MLLQMNKNNKICLSLLLLVYCGTYAQMDQYRYKRLLPEVTDTWHTVTLPDEVFGHTTPDLSDIRVFGITSEKDTIEAPYLLQLKTEKVSQKTIPFTILNTTHNQKGSYITMSVPTKQPINQIRLDFKQPNFDWKITLEGSQDRNEWFTIAEDYRILSIRNELTSYQFTTVRFPEAQYRYFRILVKHKDTENPVLQSARLRQYEIKEADYREYPVVHFNIKEQKNSRRTTIEAELETPVPVSYLKIESEDTFDYYRPISIQYVEDSIYRPHGGWEPIYSKLVEGVLTSIEDNVFRSNSAIVQKFRIFIDNHDNEPLKIKKVVIKGYQHSLVTRFTNPAAYYLTYGNDKVGKPSYDLNYVASKIPETMTAILPGAEEFVDPEESAVSETIPTPLFTNKIWLWAVMGIIIVLLGGFTLSMMKKNNTD